tara:strand:- start:1440 stop:2204 length:765 start_codon:yes stop_codon:yes gene_type:complete
MISILLSLLLSNLFAQEAKLPDSVFFAGSSMQIIKPSSDYQRRLLDAYKDNNDKLLEDTISSFLAENPNDLFSLNTLGAHHYRKGAVKLARLLWNRALKAHPQSDTVLNNLGVSFHREDEERATDFYKKAIKANPSNPYANFNLGSLYVKYKNFPQAEVALKLAYKELNTIEAANNYGLALRGLGKFKDSIKVYERIIRSNSDQYQALLNYATVLVNAQKKSDKAREVITRIRMLTDDKQVLKYVADLEKRIKD